MPGFDIKIFDVVVVARDSKLRTEAGGLYGMNFMAFVHRGCSVEP